MWNAWTHEGSGGDAGTVKYYLFLLAGLLCALVCICGCVSVDAEDPVYVDGNLTTTIQYEGDTRDVWVQHTIYQVDGLSMTELNTSILPYTFSTGKQICEVPINLPAGSYKVHLYVLGRGESADRIGAFIRTFEVV